MRVTLDPNFKGSYITLSNNKLIVFLDKLNERHFIRSTKGIRSGKYYVEFTFNKGNRICFGLVSEDVPIKDTNNVFGLWQNPNSENSLSTGSSVCWLSITEGSDKRGYISGSKDITNDFTKEPSLALSLNDTIGIAIDMNKKTASFYRNGTLEKTMTGLPDKVFYPAIGLGTSYTTTPLAASATINYGEFGFKYPVSEGYRPYYEIDYNPIVHLDPNYCGNDIQLSDRNLTASMTLSSTKANFVRATHGVSSGKWYFEIKHKNGTSTIGLVSEEAENINTSAVFHDYSASTVPLTKGSGVCWFSNNIRLNGQITATSDIVSPRTDDSKYFIEEDSIIGISVNMDDKIVSFYKNGVFQESITNIPNKTFYPAIGINGNTSDNLKDRSVSANFGEHGFEYQIPDGFKAYYLVNSNRVVTSTPLVSLDPAIKWTGMDLSDNNLMITTNSSVSNIGGFVRATHGASTGKWYFEVEVIQDGAYLTVGIISDCNADFNRVAGFTDKWNTPSRLPVGSGVSYVCYDTPPNQAYVTTTNDIDPNSPVTEINPTWVCSAGDIVGVAFNMDDHTIAFYRNGVHLKTVSNLGNEKYFAGITSFYDNDGCMQCRVNFGDKPFKYFIYSGVAQYNFLAYEKIAETYRPLVRLDTVYKGYGIQLLDRRLTAYLGGLQYQKTDIANFVRANYGVRYGKWYWEVYKNLPGGTSIGIVSRDTVDKDTDYNLGNDAAMTASCVTGTASSVISTGSVVNNGYLQNTNDFPVHVDEANISYFYGVGGTVGIVMDLDNKMLYYYNDNVLIRSFIMPATEKEMFAAVGEFIGLFDYAPDLCSVTFNFGEEAPFKYPVPQENTKPYYYLLYDNMREDIHVY